MTGHKYHVGERVEYVRDTLYGTAASGAYTITRCMPTDGADPQYRVKSANETHERTMRENQLRKD